MTKNNLSAVPSGKFNSFLNSFTAGVSIIFISIAILSYAAAPINSYAADNLQNSAGTNNTTASSDDKTNQINNQDNIQQSQQNSEADNNQNTASNYKKNSVDRRFDSEYKLVWSNARYADNFIRNFFPSDKAVMKMDVWGFVYLWGLVSFIENNIPVGLDGSKYKVSVRDLKKEIEFLKNDMIFLVKEIWGIRKIDRKIIPFELLNIYSKLKEIILTVQRVRTNLIKPAYFLFYNSLDHTIFFNDSFDFSVTLNYLSVDSIWSGWRENKDLWKELDTAKELGVNTVKIGVYLDYWVYKNTARINEIRELLQKIKDSGFNLYINFMGVRGFYGEDLTFKQKSGRPFGTVNFITWRYHCEQAMSAVIAEFKPKYATIIKEPFIDFQEQINETVPVELWLGCVSDFAAEISKKSPGTIIVIENTLSSEADYDLFQKFQKIKPSNVAFGALIYSLKDMFSYNQYIKMCKVSKDTIVAEFWDSVALYIDEYADDFIYLVYRYALNKKMKLINLAYILNLHTYDFKPTPAFYTYKHIISMAFMEGICKKGIKSGTDIKKGILNYGYSIKNVNYQFWNEITLKDYKN
ncbi:MAG: hypothetical protein QMC67_01950 [Candidatus Wallbacteria bacterium]